MTDNINVELDDDQMWNAKGGLSNGNLNEPRFGVGDSVRFRAVDDSGNQEIRIGRVLTVASSEDGWSNEYTVDSCDHPVSEVNLKAV